MSLVWTLFKKNFIFALHNKSATFDSLFDSRVHSVASKVAPLEIDCWDVRKAPDLSWIWSFGMRYERHPNVFIFYVDMKLFVSSVGTTQNDSLIYSDKTLEKRRILVLYCGRQLQRELDEFRNSISDEKWHSSEILENRNLFSSEILVRGLWWHGLGAVIELSASSLLHSLQHFSTEIKK